MFSSSRRSDPSPERRATSDTCTAVSTRLREIWAEHILTYKSRGTSFTPVVIECYPVVGYSATTNQHVLITAVMTGVVIFLVCFSSRQFN
jgi:hypothetical protein